MADSLVANLRSRLAAGARQTVCFVGRVIDGVRSRVRRLWGSTRRLFEAASGAAPDEAEVARRKAVTAAVRERLGECPLAVIRGTLPTERGELLNAVATHACKALDIPPVSVAVKPMTSDLAGEFNFASRRVTVSRDEAARIPMSEDEALELMDTVLHEVYHAFQRQAIKDARRYGVDSVQAEVWREEFANYVSPDQNPQEYWRQSVEVTARGFAHAVVTAL